jgi:hypothetical protein
MSESILQEAQRIVHGTRNSDYGHPLDNHSRTAAFWSTYLGVAISAEDVCMLNALQKISRGMNSITHDTLVDVAGYAANIEMIQRERERRDQLPCSGPFTGILPERTVSAIPDMTVRSPATDA